jgi:hypothetical protein
MGRQVEWHSFLSKKPPSHSSLQVPSRRAWCFLPSSRYNLLVSATAARLRGRAGPPTGKLSFQVSSQLAEHTVYQAQILASYHSVLVLHIPPQCLIHLSLRGGPALRLTFPSTARAPPDPASSNSPGFPVFPPNEPDQQVQQPAQGGLPPRHQIRSSPLTSYLPQTATQARRVCTSRDKTTMV